MSERPLDDEDRIARNAGPGRLLIAVYAVFAVGATSRALYQILTKFDDAPTAYLLSALAAVVYVVATVALTLRGATSWRVALAAVVVEMTGVLVVGTLTTTGIVDFPADTVWSDYGRGYLFIPLVLPVFGLMWLRRTSDVLSR